MSAQAPEPRASVERELEQLARRLGGGWRWDGPEGFKVMPTITLSLDEARALSARLPLASDDAHTEEAPK